jgi:hypothetical protein
VRRKKATDAFEVPALRGVYFVALDETGIAVKRMRSDHSLFVFK